MWNSGSLRSKLGELINIYHDFVEGIDKSVSKMLHHVIPSSDLRSRFVYPFLKLMMDSFSCILFGASVESVLP